jgi:hypothetical protein
MPATLTTSHSPVVKGLRLAAESARGRGGSSRCVLAGEHEAATVGQEVQIVRHLHVGLARFAVHFTSAMGCIFVPVRRHLHQVKDLLLVLQAVQAHEPGLPFRGEAEPRHVDVGVLGAQRYRVRGPLLTSYSCRLTVLLASPAFGYLKRYSFGYSWFL